MKKQAFNPYLPSWEYVPDGEPYLIGGRVYVFGSHDHFGGKEYCPGDYVCWSAPEDDLGDWRYEGVIYRKTQDPLATPRDRVLFAPDVVQGRDGRWYLYYTLASNGIMSVAVCDTPAGQYEYLGAVRTADGHIIGSVAGDLFQFDPGVLMDDDGCVYLYSGFSPRPGPWADEIFCGKVGDGAYCMQLADDMLTVVRGPVRIAEGVCCAKGTSFEEHPFFEASSIRKIGGKYYFSYSSVHMHELCYAVSDSPMGGFSYRGVLVSNGDVGFEGRAYRDALNYMGNDHGGLVCVKGQWYAFYHRHTNRSVYSRQTCAEAIEFRDGAFSQAELTSCGLNGGPLKGAGYYPAYIACNLVSAHGVCFSDRAGENDPCFTQDGGDREGGDPQYIAGLRKGAWAGFKYFDLTKTKAICVTARGAGGLLVVSDTEGELARIRLQESKEWTKHPADLLRQSGERAALFLRYEGDGSIDLKGFLLTE